MRVETEIGRHTLNLAGIKRQKQIDAVRELVRERNCEKDKDIMTYDK